MLIFQMDHVFKFVTHTTYTLSVPVTKVNNGNIALASFGINVSGSVQSFADTPRGNGHTSTLQMSYHQDQCAVLLLFTFVAGVFQ